jgi:hypothetical protein
MPFDSAELVWLIADARVVADGDPTVPADLFEPYFIRTVRLKMILVLSDFKAGGCAYLRKSRA